MIVAPAHSIRGGSYDTITTSSEPRFRLKNHLLPCMWVYEADPLGVQVQAIGRLAVKVIAQDGSIEAMGMGCMDA